MNVERFEDLEAWQQARQLTKMVYDLTDPTDRRMALALEVGEELLGCEDSDSAKGLESEQMVVPRDNHVRSAAYGALQDAVVGRIFRDGADRFGRIDDRGDRPQDLKGVLNSFPTVGEFRLQDALQLGQQVRAREPFEPFGESRLYDRVGNAAEEQTGHEYIRVQDDPEHLRGAAVGTPDLGDHAIHILRFELKAPGLPLPKPGQLLPTLLALDVQARGDAEQFRPAAGFPLRDGVHCFQELLWKRDVHGRHRNHLQPLSIYKVCMYVNFGLEKQARSEAVMDGRK